LIGYAKQQVQTEVQLWRPCGFEAVVMAVLLEHEKRVEQAVKTLEERPADKE
jgi:hypothetical protein